MGYLPPSSRITTTKVLWMSTEHPSAYIWHKLQLTWEENPSLLCQSKSLENIKQVFCQNLEPVSSLMYSPICATEVKARWSAWLVWRRVGKGGGKGVNYLNTITASNNRHPSLASSHSNTAKIPSPHLGWLSRQIGQTLCHPTKAPPCTKRKPEWHSKRTFTPLLLVVFFSLGRLTLKPPLDAGELPLTALTPREGWKGQTCQAECYLNSSEWGAPTPTHCQYIRSGIMPRCILANRVTHSIPHDDKITSWRCQPGRLPVLRYITYMLPAFINCCAFCTYIFLPSVSMVHVNRNTHTFILKHFNFP